MSSTLNAKALPANPLNMLLAPAKRGISLEGACPTSLSVARRLPHVFPEIVHLDAGMQMLQSHQPLRPALRSSVRRNTMLCVD